MIKKDKLLVTLSALDACDPSALYKFAAYKKMKGLRPSAEVAMRPKVETEAFKGRLLYLPVITDPASDQPVPRWMPTPPGYNLNAMVGEEYRVIAPEFLPGTTMRQTPPVRVSRDYWLADSPSEISLPSRVVYVAGGGVITPSWLPYPIRPGVPSITRRWFEYAIQKVAESEEDAKSLYVVACVPVRAAEPIMLARYDKSGTFDENPGMFESADEAARGNYFLEHIVLPLISSPSEQDWKWASVISTPIGWLALPDAAYDGGVEYDPSYPVEYGLYEVENGYWRGHGWYSMAGVMDLIRGIVNDYSQIVPIPDLHFHELQTTLRGRTNNRALLPEDRLVNGPTSVWPISKAPLGFAAAPTPTPEDDWEVQADESQFPSPMVMVSVLPMALGRTGILVREAPIEAGTLLHPMSAVLQSVPSMTGAALNRYDETLYHANLASVASRYDDAWYVPFAHEDSILLVGGEASNQIRLDIGSLWQQSALRMKYHLYEKAGDYALPMATFNSLDSVMFFIESTGFSVPPEVVARLRNFEESVLDNIASPTVMREDDVSITKGASVTLSNGHKLAAPDPSRWLWVGSNVSVLVCMSLEGWFYAAKLRYSQGDVEPAVLSVLLGQQTIVRHFHARTTSLLDASYLAAKSTSGRPLVGVPGWVNSLPGYCRDFDLDLTRKIIATFTPLSVDAALYRETGPYSAKLYTSGTPEEVLARLQESTDPGIPTDMDWEMFMGYVDNLRSGHVIADACVSAALPDSREHHDGGEVQTRGLSWNPIGG